RAALSAPKPVPHLGVPGAEPQCPLLAAAADQDWHRTRRPWLELRDPLLDAGQRGLQRAQPVARLAELVPVLVVVAFEPSRSQPEHEAPSGKLVDGPCHVRDEVWIAVE